MLQRGLVRSMGAYQVLDPDAGHLVHGDQGALISVVQGGHCRVLNSQSPHRQLSLTQISMPKLCTGQPQQAQRLYADCCKIDTGKRVHLFHLLIRLIFESTYVSFTR